MSAGDHSGAAGGSLKSQDSKSNPESHVITIKEIKDGYRKAKSKSAAVIQKVPEELRKLKDSAYTPRFVSIGPLHSNKDHLKKNIKLSYVYDLFGRMAESGQDEKDQVLKRCQDEMRKLVGEARKFYAENGELLTADMLVIDGCFVLELLNRKHMDPTSDDPIHGSGLVRDGVQIDLLLLENQLPFFVLEKLFVLTEKARRNPPLKSYSIQQCILKYFHNLNFLEYHHNEKCLDQDPECKPSGSSKSTGNSFHHILHFLHEHLIHQNSKKEEVGEIVPMKSAQDLEFAGVKFARQPSSCSFQVDFIKRNCLQYLFHRAAFKMPTLKINNATEPVLRNLIAFEQCTLHAPSFVTSYAYLMDRLVNTAKDVEVLIEAGVLKNYLASNEEVSDLFNKLCKEVVLGDFHFKETCKNVADYSELCWPGFMGYMRRNYFAKPWTFAAFVVAFLAFNMTVGTFIRNLLR